MTNYKYHLLNYKPNLNNNYLIIIPDSFLQILHNPIMNPTRVSPPDTQIRWLVTHLPPPRSQTYPLSPQTSLASPHDSPSRTSLSSHPHSLWTPDGSAPAPDPTRTRLPPTLPTNGPWPATDFAPGWVFSGRFWTRFIRRPGRRSWIRGWWEGVKWSSTQIAIWRRSWGTRSQWSSRERSPGESRCRASRAWMVRWFWTIWFGLGRPI